jgi:HD-GYP domain-containing protein (c-di-GMP phosphodiesterase class II)
MNLRDLIPFKRSTPPAAPAPRTGDNPLISSLLVLAWIVEARDPYTGGHLWRVAQLSRLLAQACGLPSAEVARIGLGGFLHDLGKIAVPDAILRKAGKLTDEEYAVIKTHPEAGRGMLAGHPLADLVLDAIHMHHETPDGNGYPQGLKLAQIPMAARIVGICDAFDAMTSHRPYRAGMPVETALGIISRNLGSQFDLDVGNRFLRLGKEDAVRHIVGHTDEGIPLRQCLSCGPTLVLRRESVAGDKVYCQACTSEYQVHKQAGALTAAPTGAKGNAADLQPRPDMALIARFAAQS